VSEVPPAFGYYEDRTPTHGYAETGGGRRGLGQGALAMSVAPPNGQNRIMIYGPKPDGTYIVEFRMANGEALAISVPAGETRVVKYFQERMPYGLLVLDCPHPGRTPNLGPTFYPSLTIIGEKRLRALSRISSDGSDSGKPHSGARL
jgi:hypothetical protein